MANPNLPVAKLDKPTRVLKIIKLMRENQWKASMTRPMAEEMGIKIDTMKQDVAEASRHIRLSANPDAAGAKLITLLEAEIDKCIEECDRKNLVKLMDLYGKVNNVYSDRVDVSVTHEVKAFNPRDARAEFYKVNNRIGDMTDTLNVEVIDVVEDDTMAPQLPVGDRPDTGDEPF